MSVHRPVGIEHRTPTEGVVGMGKLAEAVASIPLSGRPKCTFGAWYATLSKAHRADVDEVLEGDAYGTTIATAIERVYGAKLSAETVRRHRNGDCSCPR